MAIESEDPLSRLGKEERFSLLVASVTDYALYLISPAGLVSSWNPGAQAFKGYAEEEVIGKHFSCFYTPEDRAAGLPQQALASARELGRFEGEGWRMRKDGSRFWASVVIDRIRDEHGELIGFAKITRDISEQRKARLALEESERSFRLLVQGVADYAIHRLSPGGEVSSWNIGAQRIKGYTESEILGAHFSRFYTEEDRASGLPAAALASAERAGHYEDEGWRVRKDGSRFWAHVVIDAIRDEQGRLTGFANITRDISEKREAAAALERANAALFQAQKLEAIGQLTGGVAHDFNNLLAVIVNGLDLLALQPQAAATGRVLESMRRAATRGATLTQQLLAYARKQPLNPEKSDVNRLILGFEAVLRRAVHAAVSFELDLAPALPAVLLDAARFESTLLNLAVNARDAMPDGGWLRISTARAVLARGQVGALAAGDYVRVTVADGGSGMAPDVAARAFEPFFTTKEIGKGTGLGLSQVYGFVTQSGGDVTLDTAPGRGTTLSLYLPAAGGAAQAEPGQEAPQSAEQRSRDAARVLVVDDEPDVLEVTVELFRNMGYEVLCARTGREALDVLETGADIGLMFSDVMMPGGMSGIELARRARGIAPRMRIMLASGYPLPALQEQHGALDEFTLLSKPYRLADIVRTLRMPE
jgi:PAS domain S-box-containing protein